MSDFIKAEEDFSLKLIEKVPEPYAEECFLLYQAGEGIQNSMVISSGVRYSSATVRHGHYNKKATLSLKSASFSKRYRVVMKNANFSFNVDVKISYGVQDVQQYYFYGQIQEEDIHYIIREVVKGQNKKWNVSQGWKLQNTLETQIECKLKSHKGVKFEVLTEVTPDDAALKIQKSNQDKEIGIHTSDNKAKEQIAMNAHKKKVAASELELKMQQIQEMDFMMRNFGVLGPIVDEYMQGKINGQELYDYIIKARTNEMNMLNAAMSNEMLTQKEAFDKLNEILSGSRFAQANQQLQGGEKESLEAQEEGEKDDVDNTPKEAAPTDGDFV